MERVLTVASVFHSFRALQSYWPAFILCLAFPIYFSASVEAYAARGTPPRVYFDLAPAVACQDVTPSEFAEANPDEKLVQATFEVSSLIRSGKEDDLIQFFYRVESLKQTIRIVDYSPKTTLASDVAGNLSIEKKKEATNHIGLALTGPFDWPVKASGSGDLGSKSLGAVRYELLPQMVAVAASGTIHRGYGVYFKLRPSRGTSLEGAKELTVVFRVPTEWRGDYVQLSCNAIGIRRGVVPPLDERAVCGARRFIVPLYVEGDASAKAAAERLVRAESELLRSVSANRREIEKRLYPTIAHKIGAFLDVIEPTFPDDWAEHLIYGPDHGEIDGIVDRLPSEVRHAVAEYSVARHELFRLGATPRSEVQ